MTTRQKAAHVGPALSLRLVAGRGIARHGLMRLPPEGSGLAPAMALAEPSPGTARSHSADRCRIALRGDRWMLTNGSRRLVCALNGRRVRAGEEAVVQLGDTLELGLLRFLVVAGEEAGRRSDPFDGLDIGKGEARVPGVHTGHRSPADVFFDRLNDEFVAVVSDPLQLSGQTDWPKADAPAGARAPTLDELRAQAMPFASLRDILLPRTGIDTVIGDFDSFGEFDVAHAPAQADVLRLFAPELAQRGAAQLPGLTRREHHAMSIDSAMALGNVRPGDDRTVP